MKKKLTTSIVYDREKVCDTNSRDNLTHCLRRNVNHYNEKPQIKNCLKLKIEKFLSNLSIQRQDDNQGYTQLWDKKVDQSGIEVEVETRLILCGAAANCRTRYPKPAKAWLERTLVLPLEIQHAHKFAITPLPLPLSPSRGMLFYKTKISSSI